MFGEIAGRYDFLNHLLSAGIDRRWRRRTTELAPLREGGPVLDVCTGTGDLALAYWQSGGGEVEVVGADFCRPMLEIGLDKVRRAGAGDTIRLVEADTEHLPFANDRFEIVSVAFGLRNVSDTDVGLREMARVCRPGGRVVVLEFSMPRSRIIRGAYGRYFRRLVPLVGQALAKNRQDAYNYLPASVQEFPEYEALVERFREVGLKDVHYRRLTFGVATLYVGVK
ncbi:MAG: bifunctional demethylmenaquinone methyltransferase/2-methoxy-6-polyprenyl-1,4-benzoquinol methylase UbiE [Pirellulales bacterium]|nr:bifunctional demethylmenaquinone methyltransferase/2-methoxy-6-polyprenyl-1,4-benzoquinol methylase UbiE [Pirellulales bacterium]